MPGDNQSQGDKELSILLTNTFPEDGGDGPRDVEFEKDDFTEPVKLRLGQYLNQIIDDSGNRYRPSPTQGGEDQTFTREMSVGLGAVAVREFENTSNTNYLDGIHVNKTTQPDPNKVTRTELFEDINLHGAGANLPKAVFKLTRENNRFSGENPYIDESQDQVTENTAGTKDWIPQSQFGSHSPRTWPTSDGAVGSTPITIQNLKDLGAQILIEGSGEVISSRNSSKIGDTPEALIAVTATPGAARIGGRVAYSRFSAGNIIGDINPDYSPPKVSSLEQDGPEKMSYGSPYNPLVPFAGLGVATSQVASSLLVLTVTGMITALAETMKNAEAVIVDTPGNDSKNNSGGSSWANSSRSSRLGSYNGTARVGLGRSGTRSSSQSGNSWLGLYETTHDYNTAIQRGLQVFFDLPVDGGSVGIGSTTHPESIGFYTTLLRSLVRDTSDVMVGSVAAFAPRYSIRGSIEVGTNVSGDATSSPADIANSLASFADSVRNSRLLRFMDVVARMGDLALSLEEDGLGPGQTIQDVINDAVSDSEYISKFGTNLNMASLHLRNRTSDRILGTRALSTTLASNAVLSMYSVPGEYVQGEKDFFGDTPITDRLKSGGLYFKSTDSLKRLPPELVEQYEDEMEAYYMPFYFQDLRTNEFIGFHAFIEDIQDGFKADYSEKSDGIGRVGRIMAYKNTQRDISVSFIVVATNPDDFDEMWLKINKLVMLLYPQYTQGRVVTNPETGHKFIQPFSQMIGSSPLVRMRVGDLIKSNFSEFDLARLFGVGTKNFVINGDAQARNADLETKTQRKMTKIREDMSAGTFLPNDQVLLATQLTATVNTSDINRSNRRISLTQQSATEARTSSRRSPGQRGGRGATRRPPRSRANQQTITAVNGNTVIIQREITSSDGSPSATRVYEGIISPRPEHASSTDTFVFSVTPGTVLSQFKLDDDFIRRRARREVETENPTPETTAGQSNVDEVRQFFSPRGTDGTSTGGNPIVQGFESTRGKGLAGFITNLRMNYDKDAMWETEWYNSRAPAMVKIQLDFSPVDDLAPGIGADGFMTGAPYNIGSIMALLKKSRSADRNDNARKTMKLRRGEAQAQRSSSAREDSKDPV